MMKAISAFTVMLLFALPCAQAQVATGTPATVNPFAEPLRTVVTPASPGSQGSAVVAPPAPVYANVLDGNDPFENVAVLYLTKDDALLRVAGRAGDINERLAYVQNNVRMRIGNRWVIPHIENGKLMFYLEKPQKDAAGGQKGDRSELVWTGLVRPLDGPQTESVGIAAQMNMPRAIGADIASPSRKAIDASASSVIGSSSANNGGSNGSATNNNYGSSNGSNIGSNIMPSTYSTAR